MLRAKVSGPLINRVVDAANEILEPTHEADQLGLSRPSGDLYIHIHLGWKAFLVLVYVVIQMAITYINMRHYVA